MPRSHPAAIALFAWALFSPLGAWSQPAAPAPVRAAEALTDGDIRRIDAQAGKLTIRHGEIANLDMPPMTMVFTVRDKALLEGLQAGDRVRFHVVHDNGQMLITRIQRAP